MVAVVPIDNSSGDEALAAFGDGRGRASESTGPERWPQFPGMRVLIAEDTAINRNVVIASLRRFGCAIESIEDGLEADAAAARSPFDLVRMDCQMPRLDGVGATAAIRTGERASGARRRLAIVALTANAMRGDRDRCLAAGMDDHLAKPVRREQLAALLARWYRPGQGLARGPAAVSFREPPRPAATQVGAVGGRNTRRDADSDVARGAWNPSTKSRKPSRLALAPRLSTSCAARGAVACDWSVPSTSPR